MPIKNKSLYLPLCFLLFLSSALFSKEDTKEYQIYFGSSYGNNNIIVLLHPNSFLDFGSMYSVTPYIGLEINWNQYVGLLQTIEVPLWGSSYNYKIDYIGLLYALGLRTYLGTQYVFIDLMFSTGFISSIEKDNSKFWIYSFIARLGFNIPLSDSIHLQTFIGINTPIMIEFTAGLNFKL